MLPDDEWIVSEAIHAQYLYISAATHPDAASSVGDTTFLVLGLGPAPRWAVILNAL